MKLSKIKQKFSPNVLIVLLEMVVIIIIGYFQTINK